MSILPLRLLPMILVLAFGLQGCGVKGPLYLPEKPPAGAQKAQPQEAR